MRKCEYALGFRYSEKMVHFLGHDNGPRAHPYLKEMHIEIFRNEVSGSLQLH